jgi:hypothetical protein
LQRFQDVDPRDKRGHDESMAGAAGIKRRRLLPSKTLTNAANSLTAMEPATGQQHCDADGINWFDLAGAAADQIHQSILSGILPA